MAREDSQTASQQDQVGAAETSTGWPGPPHSVKVSAGTTPPMGFPRCRRWMATRQQRWQPTAMMPAACQD